MANIEFKPRVESVGLLILDARGRLWCLEELKPKPEIGKIPGVKDRSFPWETKKANESNEVALSRLIHEEVDETGQLCISDMMLIGQVPVYDTLAHIYFACFICGPENMRGADAGIEVRPLGWQTRSFLLERCRDGVSDVLRLFDSYSEVPIA